MGFFIRSLVWLLIHNYPVFPPGRRDQRLLPLGKGKVGMGSSFELEAPSENKITNKINYLYHIDFISYFI
jgi:hypothetical protein